MTTKKEIIGNYDTTARIYDMQYREEQLLKISFTLKRVMPRAGDTVIDAGCGTGMLFEHLDHCGLLVGVDPSINMLREARKRTREGGNTELVLGDVEALPFRGGSCDVVFCISVLQLMDDPRRGLEEILRILKSRGSFAATLIRKARFAQDLDRFVRGAFVELYDSESMKDVFLIGQRID
ncbi:MAG: class I SAM-dependent methyltransferase [Candidatus Verstraetearchaeota archaeon]|nr:class I SAM-dependent methyltransferase [Candidatus Verstraetearchaeota archaeon]